MKQNPIHFAYSGCMLLQISVATILQVCVIPTMVKILSADENGATL